MINTPTRGLGKANLATGGLGTTFGTIVEEVTRVLNIGKRRFFNYYNTIGR